MTDVFLKLLNMSFTASFLIVAVIILRLVLKRAPKQAVCILWGLVAIRLICPISFESVLSLIPSANPIPAEIEYMASPEIESGIGWVDNTVNPIIVESFAPETEVVTSVNPLQIWLFIASVVWIIGLGIMLLYAGISYLLLQRKVRASILMEDGFYKENICNKNICNDNIYICDDIDSPFILGIIRPRIYLPSGMEERANKYVIAHERAHLKRLDHLWKPFGFLLLSVYWFHPLIWVAYILLCRDIELACDEKVVKDMGVEDKKEYSKALISCSASRKMIAACPLAFGEVGVKERVKSVLNYRKPSFWILLIVLLVLVGVVVFFMTNPVSEQAESKEDAWEQDTWEEAGADDRTEDANITDGSDKIGDANEMGGTEHTDDADRTRYINELLYEKYVDVIGLEIREGVGETDITFGDRHFICEDGMQNELENLIYNYYYFAVSGDYDKVEELVGEKESLKIAIQNEKAAFEEGNYMSEYKIHELSTLTAEEVQNASDNVKEYIGKSIEKHELTEFAIIKADISWKHNEKSLSMAPQLPDGRYNRYYLLATTSDSEDFKLYEIYWEDFYPQQVVETKPTLEQVMDRILSEVPLEEAKSLTTTADLPQGDQLYFLDGTADGKYSLYGFHSDEYQYSGLLVNYRIGGDDNWTYLANMENWIGYEFPQIVEAEGGGAFLTYCYAGGSGVHRDRFFYLKPYETGTLDCYELTKEDIMEQVESLVAFQLDEEKEEVQVFTKESGSEVMFALISYKQAMNGQNPQIKEVQCSTDILKFLLEPAMVITGVGISVEGSVMPIYVGELAFRVEVEESGEGVSFNLHDVSTYDYGVSTYDYNVSTYDHEEFPGQEKEVSSEEEAVALVKEQLIEAYENIYGPYEPSDVEPTLYSDDSERLAYIIPRLAVSEETDKYYVIPVMWDFRVYKDSGVITVYYNGIDSMEYTFDPTNRNHLAFAG